MNALQIVTEDRRTIPVDPSLDPIPALAATLSMRPGVKLWVNGRGLGDAGCYAPAYLATRIQGHMPDGWDVRAEYDGEMKRGVNNFWVEGVATEGRP